MITKLQEAFRKVYKENPTTKYFSPGRVNLIGEYTDIAGGKVFPAALTIGTYAVVGKRADSKICFYSTNFEKIGVITVDINNITYQKEDDWANYMKGMIVEYQKLGLEIPYGLNIIIGGNIPNGAGLSSSASIEVLMGVILSEEYHFKIDSIENVKAAQRCENQFIGVNCGIMDQFAVQMGKTNSAILINTKTLEYAYASLPLDKIDIVVLNTNKRRGLQDSKYNERRSEVDSAISDLKNVLEFHHLCDLSKEVFDQNSYVIKNKEAFKRAKHVVYENERVIKALEVLKEGEIEGFGKLLNESHFSLQNDFCVTGVELDTLVLSAQKFGAIGARMTGAGFGGCAVMISYKEKTQDILEKIKQEYIQSIGYEPTFYIVSLGQGARRLD